MGTLANRTAIVTGGAQGIGKAIAKAFLESGAAVVIGDLDIEAGEETAAELSSLGDCRFVAADVADEEQVERLVTAAAGVGRPLGALVNNAGTMVREPVTELSLADWRRVIDVNLTGAFLCAKHALPHLRRACGAIVNIASTRAFMSEADTEAYAAGKGGLVALTHALAISAGPEVRVNAVSPGWIAVEGWKKSRERREPELSARDHAQHPAGRVGRPEDVARAVLFLCAEEKGFMTGANLVLDGGMTRKMIYEE
ncbi:MAG: glucose 1-dehydrogenase [Candidatus Eisenbacteria bacterium]|nr:glucose 1-dehydrogenase [Candidatus Eisenbacteria bacterium]